MIVVNVAISLDCSSASSTPVRTVKSLPSADRIRCVSCSGVVPLRRRSLNRVELTLLVQQLLRRRHVEDREGGAADRAQVAVLGDPDDLELLRRAERGDADPVADLQALVVGDALVDRHLAPPLGQRPSTRLSGLKRSNSGSVSIPNANAGAPPVSIASPSGRSSFV